MSLYNLQTQIEINPKKCIETDKFIYVFFNFNSLLNQHRHSMPIRTDLNVECELKIFEAFDNLG